MPVDYIRYDILAQEALRGVVRTAMADAARNGLPGDHHFYVTFDTHAAGVTVSERLRAQYPQDMTIVLQHQFWDLAVNDDGFEVGLAFNGVAERLVVPFAAIKSFVDPSVQFGLQFEVLPQEAAESGEVPVQGAAPAASAERDDAPSKRKPRKPARHAHRPMQNESPPAPANPNASADGGRSEGGGEVVRLDRFRKK